LPLKIFAYALFNLFYDKEKDINDLPLLLKASVIADLISGASDNAYSCIDSGFLNTGTLSSDLPSSIELVDFYNLIMFGFIYID